MTTQPQLQPEYLARTLSALLQEAHQQIVVLTTIVNQQADELAALRPTDTEDSPHQ